MDRAFEPRLYQALILLFYFVLFCVVVSGFGSSFFHLLFLSSFAQFLWRFSPTGSGSGPFVSVSVPFLVCVGFFILYLLISPSGPRHLPVWSWGRWGASCLLLPFASFPPSGGFPSFFLGYFSFSFSYIRLSDAPLPTALDSPPLPFLSSILTVVGLLSSFFPWPRVHGLRIPPLSILSKAALALPANSPLLFFAASLRLLSPILLSPSLPPPVPIDFVSCCAHLSTGTAFTTYAGFLPDTILVCFLCRSFCLTYDDSVAPSIFYVVGYSSFLGRCVGRNRACVSAPNAHRSSVQGLRIYSCLVPFISCLVVLGCLCVCSLPSPFLLCLPGINSTVWPCSFYVWCSRVCSVPCFGVERFAVSRVRCSGCFGWVLCDQHIFVVLCPFPFLVFLERLGLYFWSLRPYLFGLSGVILLALGRLARSSLICSSFHSFVCF